MPEIWTAVGVVVTLILASTILLMTQIHALGTRVDAHDARFDAINTRFDRIIEMIAAQASHQHH